MELEERGGLVKVVSASTNTSPSTPAASVKYSPWVQHAEWFEEASKKCENYKYAEIQCRMKNTTQLKGLYDKDSDFEDLKSSAECAYYMKDSKRSANLWMHILGKYKIG